MIALSLDAAIPEHSVIKNYLESTVSEVLADKINNGVRVKKDGKLLLNKKTLETFMKYSCAEAQKLAEKGARFKCVEGATVFNWAMHYFEEDSLEGILYNEDGTEYKPNRVIRPKDTAPAVSVPVTAKLKPQMSLFDMMDVKPVGIPEPDKTETAFDEDEFDADEPEESDIPPGLRQISETDYVDNDGVIYKQTPKQAEASIPVEKSIPDALLRIFGKTPIVAR